jgi:hypothetical protein
VATTTLEDDRALRRALQIRGRPFTLTLDAHGFKLTPKGRRLGLEIRWEDLVSGEAALATALNASLVAPLDPDGSGGRRSGRARKTAR